MTKDDKQQPTVKLTINNNLPSLFVDDIRVSVRNDGLVLLNFFADSPEGKFEQTRVVVTEQRLKSFIDSMCARTGYYPAELGEKEEIKKKKK